MVFSSEGFFAVTGFDGAWAWDIRSAEPTLVSVFSPSSSMVSPLTYTASGSNFMTDGRLIVESGGLVRISQIPRHDKITAEVRSWTVPSSDEGLGHYEQLADGQFIATGRDGALRAWDLADLGPLDLTMDLSGHGSSGPFLCADLATDGRHLATAGNTGVIRLWDLAAPDPARGSRNLTAHSGPVLALSFAHDDRLVSCGEDATVRIWAVGTDGPIVQELVLRDHKGPVNCLALARDGRLATASADATVQVWDLNATPPASVLTLRNPEKVVTRMAFAPDGRLASVLQSRTPTAQEVRVWELQPVSRLRRPAC